jgi:glycerophosphoryl diester phosphodiesterase
MSTPIAHRGLHDKNLPENSLGAFLAAAKAGYGIELDVHLAADGRLVVSHDSNTKRVAGVYASLRDTSSSKLTKMHLGNSKYHIPLLQEVLAAVGGAVPIVVEVKTGTSAKKIVPVLLQELKNYEGEYALQSFDPRIVWWLKKHAPQVPRGQLAGSFSYDMRHGKWSDPFSKDNPLPLRFLLRNMVMNFLTKPDFIGYEAASMPNRIVRFWRKPGMPLLLWVVNTDDRVKLAKNCRANIIFEDIRPKITPHS